eukprot:jgi/Bigna1/131154/aug1.13_g5862
MLQASSPPKSNEGLSAKNSDKNYGKVLTAAALVAGNMVGAGILALPSVAAKPGFVASSGLLVLTWAASAAAGLLVAESWCTAKIRGSQTSIEAMATELLGTQIGKCIGLGFVFYNLTLLIAYISQGGTIVRELIESSQLASKLLDMANTIALSSSETPLLLHPNLT